MAARGDAISVRSTAQSRNSIICFAFRGPESAKGGIVGEAAEMTKINTKQMFDRPPRGIPRSDVQLATLVKRGWEACA